MTSRLLSDLYQKVLSQRDIGKAFDYLIRQLGDLILDTPEAAVILGTYREQFFRIRPLLTGSDSGIYLENSS
jgi:hypothetical protein